jgi:tight adherence protein C
MSLLIYALIAICAAATAGFLVWAFTNGVPLTVAGRLRHLEDAPVFGTPAHTRPTDVPFGERVLRPALRSLSGLAEKLGLARDVHVIQTKLEIAGHPRIMGAAIGVREYMALKLLFYVLAAVVFLLLMRSPILSGPLGVTLTGILTLIVGMLPTLVVDHLADARKSAILKAMSDTLDLLVVSAEAGLSLDAAMGRVALKKSGPLAEEFETALQEMRLGKARADALRGIARRAGVLEVKMFTSAIIQAENLGVSIAQVLRSQAETHRERRSQRVREAAAKLPVKMMIPLIVFIMPSIFVVLAAPGLMSIMKAMGGGR